MITLYQVWVWYENSTSPDLFGQWSDFKYAFEFAKERADDIFPKEENGDIGYQCWEESEDPPITVHAGDSEYLKNIIFAIAEDLNSREGQTFIFVCKDVVQENKKKYGEDLKRWMEDKKFLKYFRLEQLKLEITEVILGFINDNDIELRDYIKDINKINNSANPKLLDISLLLSRLGAAMNISIEKEEDDC